MSRVTSMFEAYELTEEDVLNGQVLSATQLQVIHNNRTLICQEKLELECDPNNLTEFAQGNSRLQGQLDSYNFILESHYAAVDEIAARLAPDANIST